jgi:uncharacterized membrane protein YfcA
MAADDLPAVSRLPVLTEDFLHAASGTLAWRRRGAVVWRRLWKGMGRTWGLG